jgi:hypothetical protein
VQSAGKLALLLAFVAALVPASALGFAQIGPGAARPDLNSNPGGIAPSALQKVAVAKLGAHACQSSANATRVRAAELEVVSTTPTITSTSGTSAAVVAAPAARSVAGASAPPAADSRRSIRSTKNDAFAIRLSTGYRLGGALVTGAVRIV